MKRFFIALAVAFIFTHAHAQYPVGEWTWMKGDSTWGNNDNTIHSLGDKGVFSDDNVVPKLYGSASWSAGNRLYLWGGYYLNTDDGYTMEMNAMWEYNIDSNKWAWISGPGGFNAPGNQLEYWGTQGVGDSTTFPIFRDHAATWTDLDGNFWLFSGYPEATDLWKYDVQTNIWTWVKGFFDWHYGIKGVADTLNIPPPRTGAETWADKQGNLWMFGGRRSPTYQYMNDMWKYNIATNIWTWVRGDTVYDPTATYGTMGVFDTANTPEGRINNQLHWVDSLGNLYLFGGWSQLPLQGNHSDLWKFDVNLEQWAWIGGTSSLEDGGEYNTLCNTNNYPGARVEATGWVDHQGNFWMVSGHTTWLNACCWGGSNDLWKYDPYHNIWWWIDGFTSDNFEGVYGTQGVSSPANIMRTRFGSASWIDSVGNFWVWGGVYVSVDPDDYTLNDLWRYVPDSACGVYTGANGPFQMSSYGFALTPNPATDAISIVTGQQGISEVSIYSVSGVLLLTDRLLPTANTVDISQLPAGVYLITVRNQQGTGVQEFVKQ